MIVLMTLATIKQFIQDGLTFEKLDIKNYQVLVGFMVVLLALQIIAYRLVFRATVNKQEIKLNGQTIKWDNVKFINRLLHIYILKTKDKKRFYLFPTEKQSNLLFGQTIKYTDMDQIINLKKAG